MCKHLLGSWIISETDSFSSLSVRLITFWIEWRLAAGRGRERDFSTGVLEDLVGGSKFFEPETGFLAGVA